MVGGFQGFAQAFERGADGMANEIDQVRTRQRRPRSHVRHVPDQDGSRPTLPESGPKQERESIPAGSIVEVRTRYVPGQWAPGYEVVQVLSTGYKVCRRGSQDVLSEVFAIEDVREASDPSSSDTPCGPTNEEVRTVVKVAARPQPLAASLPRAMLELFQTTTRREAANVVKLTRGIGRAALKGVPKVGALPNPVGRLMSLRPRPDDLVKGLVRDHVLNRLDVSRGRPGSGEADARSTVPDPGITPRSMDSPKDLKGST